jgi:chemotaxis protein CheD
MAVIMVGMADMNVASNPDILTTLGLGSCVGIVLYDTVRLIGGLAHIMLPNSNGFEGHNRAKFADTAIIELINKMGRMGAKRPALVAKLAGGSHMFSGTTSVNVLKVGERNISACVQILNLLKIPILANDTGGHHGRTIEFYTATGALKIKTVGHGEIII